MRRPGQWVVAALALLAAGVSSGQTYYKWTDAHGTTHYSAQKPTVTARTVTVGAPPAVAPAAAATQASRAGASTALDDAKSAFRKQACSTAHSNLAVLSSGSMVLDTGSMANPADIDSATKLSFEQHSAAKLTAQEQIHDYCDKR